MKRMTVPATMVFVFTLTTILSACGGGGGGDNALQTPPPLAAPIALPAWTAPAGGNLKSIATDDVGNIFGVGETDPGANLPDCVNAGQEDAALIKFGPDGKILWSAQTGGLDRDTASKAAEHAGTVFLLRTEFPAGAPNHHLTAFDTETGGEINNLLLESSDKEAVSLRADDSGVYAVTSDETGSRLFKLDIGLNNILWTQDLPEDVAEIDLFNGDLITTGTTTTGELVVRRCDANKNFLWSSQWRAGAAVSNSGKSVKVNAAGISIAGTETESEAGGVSKKSLVLLRFGLNGGPPEETKKFKDLAGEVSDLAVDDLGNRFVVGTDIGAAKIDINNDIAWQNPAVDGEEAVLSNGTILLPNGIDFRRIDPETGDDRLP